MITTTPGQRIRYAIKSMGLTNKDVAENLGIHPATLSCVISGRSNPSNVVAQLCRRYKLSAQWIFDGVGDMFERSTSTSLGDNAVGRDDMSINKGNPDLLARALDEIGQLRVLLEHSIENNKQQAAQFLTILNNLTKQ